MRPIEVACVGLATADTIVAVPGWPEPDGRLVADAIVRSGGGPAATAAVTLARLGRRAAIVGVVGDDATGAALRAALEAEGVDVSALRTAAGATAESVILVDRAAGTRSIVHVPGLPAGTPALPDAAWIHVDHVGHGWAAATVEARRLSVDAGYPIDGLSLRGLGLYAPSEASLRDLVEGRPTTQGVAAALAAGAARVVVTLGGDGAIAADGSGAWRIWPMPVDIVSTLGAGDVFHGALLAMLLEDRPLAEAARLANVAAALSCRALDGRTAIPTRPELEAAARLAPPVEPLVLEGAG